MVIKPVNEYDKDFFHFNLFFYYYKDTYFPDNDQTFSEQRWVASTSNILTNSNQKSNR